MMTIKENGRIIFTEEARKSVQATGFPVKVDSTEYALLRKCMEKVYEMEYGE